MANNRRAYETSHHWIRFFLDLRDAPWRLWLLLGAAESKCRHLAGIPLRPEIQEELNHISLIKGVHATTAIEGNTLSEEDVEKIRGGQGQEIPQSMKYQKQEIQNMLDAYNGVVQAIEDGKGCGVSLETLKQDNAVILKGLELKDNITPGELRTYSVGVGHYRAAPAEDCEYLLNRLFEWLAEDWGLEKEHAGAEGILKAVVAHLYIAWIHPFGDGNGRCARMLEFRVLMDAGVPLIAAHLLTSYYNRTRERYYDTLSTSSRREHGEIGFVLYALQGFVDALDEQIKRVLQEQIDVTWENYVHESRFGGKLTPALRRRRDLLLEISKFEAPVSPDEIRKRIGLETLALYQGKEQRTLMRDLNFLEREKLLRKKPGGYLADKDVVKAFLPLSSAKP